MFETLKELGNATEIPEGKGHMKKIVQKQRILYLESLEEDEFSHITDHLTQEMIYGKFYEKPLPNGFRLMRLHQVLKELEEKEDQYWIDLLNTWLLKNPCIEVIMNPSKKDAKSSSKEVHENDKKRYEELGEQGLKDAQNVVEKAREKAFAPLPKEVSNLFPRPGPVSDIPKLPIKLENAFQNNVRVQFVKMKTNFASFRLWIDINELPIELRDYLTIFQVCFLPVPSAFRFLIAKHLIQLFAIFVASVVRF